jgi:hypothetical protein
MLLVSTRDERQDSYEEELQIYIMTKSDLFENSNRLDCEVMNDLTTAVRMLAELQGIPQEQVCRNIFFKVYGKPHLYLPDCLRFDILGYLTPQEVNNVAHACRDGRDVVSEYVGN